MYLDLYSTFYVNISIFSSFIFTKINKQECGALQICEGVLDPHLTQWELKKEANSMSTQQEITTFVSGP